MTRPLRVVVADDQALFRSTLQLLIDSEPDMTVVGSARDGAEAVRAVRRTVPDVAILDIRMPGVDGIAATRAIVSDPLLARTRVLILTTFEFDDNVARALRAGASGFLGKDARPAELLESIRSVADGSVRMSASATRMLVDEFLARPVGSAIHGEDRLHDLTPREREVVVLVAGGADNAEIARALGITVLTAKTHVNRAMAKLDARDRAQLVVRSYELGLVTPGGRRGHR
ncbi:DNA-binding response regulator [Gordonia spumicola]|uniref:DNA-binding response regulator n=1 Tax=Gordonia spumicola TaxID=589161 RepID=A0A7I9VEJ5_9ACTN|nr:response regulator transcription factor [Gordonia spumicola]GEE03734.1 DNA-binding response regulator [Gordonia spumicola]